jgi:hypothetical protein
LDEEVLIVELTLSSGAGVGEGGSIVLTDKKVARLIKVSSQVITNNINSQVSYKEMQDYL